MHYLKASPVVSVEHSSFYGCYNNMVEFTKYSRNGIVKRHEFSFFVSVKILLHNLYERLKEEFVNWISKNKKKDIADFNLNTGTVE